MSGKPTRAEPAEQDESAPRQEIRPFGKNLSFVVKRQKLPSPALVFAALVLALIPGLALAKIDPTCSSTTATTAIGGIVRSAKDVPVAGVKVELYQPGREIPTADFATTDALGRYRICAGEKTGAGYDTFNVHVRDNRLSPMYAMAAQPYSTYTDLGDADFTPASGHALEYLTSLRVTPNAISTRLTSIVVTWSVRSKAPGFTDMRLTLGHRDDETVPMLSAGTEDGGPEAGGWNRWVYSEELARFSTERLYWASARGFEATVQTTQMDRQPYVIDNTGPIFGPVGAQPTECGPGVVANGFSPASPRGTTNPLPTITHGVCDHWSAGARSALNPFSLRGRMCRNPQLTADCENINPVLNVQNITWYPNRPLELGAYYFGWHIEDNAGNAADSPIGYELLVVARGGQIPFFNTLQPATFGSGTSGIVVGSSLTTPPSLPYIGFKVLDADGQRDLSPGTLHVRVYYGDERTLVYDYDPSKQKNEYDPATKKGGADFDLSGGVFRADGYPLQLKPPGRYIATASISDYGGNSATVTWHWILVAAL